MLRGTRENISSRALICNCAGVIALCFLLLASVVAIPQANLQGALLTPAYAQETEGDEAETAELEQNQTETLGALQGIAALGEITDSEGLAEVAEATDSEELAEIAGASDSEELVDLVNSQPNPTEPSTSEEPPTSATPGTTDLEAIEAIARVPDLEGLAELVGASDPEELLELVIP
jgi:hypothetical protein